MTTPIYPMVAIDLDDGNTEDYTNAFPIASARGIPLTTYINTGRVGNTGKLTWAQIHELLAANWAVECHTHDHENLTELTEQQIRDNMEAVNDAFAEQGLDYPRHHAYPHGAHDATVRSILAEYRDSGRGVGGSTEVIDDWGQAVDWYQLKAYALYNYTVNQMKGMIDDAITNNEVLILYTHRVKDDPGSLETSPEDFTAICDHIQGKNGAIEPVTIKSLYAMVEGTAPIALQKPASDIELDSATINGKVLEDDGKDCETRFRRRKAEPIISDDFEWGSDGDDIDDSGGDITWTKNVGGTSTAKISTDQAYSGTRSLRLYRDGTNHLAAHFSQAAGTGYRFSFRIRKDDTGIFNFQHGDGTNRIVIRYSSDEKIYYHDGTAYQDTGVTLGHSKWHKIEICNIDWVAATCDIYANGELVKADAAMQASASTSNIALFWSGGGTDNIYLDDVAVEEEWVETSWDNNGGLYYNTGDDFSTGLTDLDAATLYVYQVQARDRVTEDEGSWSESEYFETLTIPKPTAILEATSGIQSTSATVNGKISNDGGADCQARFRWAEVLAFDDFEWGVDGDDIDTSGGDVTWTQSIAGGTSSATISTDQASSGTRSLRIYCDEDNHNVVARFDHTAGDGYEIDFDVWGVLDDRISLFHGDGTHRFRVYVNGGTRELGWWDGGWNNLGVYLPENEWSTISIRNINWNEQTYDIYLNGELIVTATSMNESTSNANRVEFWMYTGEAAIYIDDVLIRKIWADIKWVEGYSDSGGDGIRRKDEYLRIHAKANTGNEEAAVIDDAVDLTNVDTIYVDWENLESGNIHSGLIASTVKDGDYDTYNARLPKWTTAHPFTRTTESLDVSGLSGNHYIRLYARGWGNDESELKVFAVWMEGSGIYEQLLKSKWSTSDWDDNDGLFYNTNDEFSHSLTDLGLDTGYVHQVQARNVAGEGAWSASGYFTTLAVISLIVSELLSLSDTPSETMKASVARVDGFSASASASQLGKMSTTRLDSLGLSGSAAVSALMSLLRQDGVDLSDSSLVSMLSQLLRTDTLALTDTPSELTRMAVSRLDTLNLSDEAIIALLAQLLRSDTLALSDEAIIALIEAIRLSVLDSLSLSDTGTVGMKADVSREDTLNLADTSLAQMLAQLVRSDSVTLSDEARIKALLSVVEQLNLSDLPSCVMKALVEHSDTLTLSDSQNIAMLARLVRSETLNLQDNALVTMLAQVLRQETLTLEDLVLFARIGELVKLWLFTKTYHDVTIWIGDGDMTIRRDWHRGETVPIWAEVKLESTGALHDPDQGVLVTAINSAGTKVLDAQAMTKSEVGKYVYYWNSPVDAIPGWYRCSGKAQDGIGGDAKITIEHGGFQLFE